MLLLSKKIQDGLLNLVDDVLDENNLFNDQIKTEDRYIDDNLFDDTDSRDKNKVPDGVINEINFGGNIEILYKMVSKLFIRL